LIHPGYLELLCLRETSEKLKPIATAVSFFSIKLFEEEGRIRMSDVKRNEHRIREPVTGSLLYLQYSLRRRIVGVYTSA
jgi:hypothetical protein